MKFTVKRKIDGQNWKKLNVIYASSFMDAKKEFTEEFRKAAAEDNSYILLEDKADAKRHFGEDIYQGRGYYSETADVILDDKDFSFYRNDVFQYTINVVDY